MIYPKTVTVTIKAGEQDSNDIPLDPMTVAHTIYSPQALSGIVTVQAQHFGTGWCDLPNATIGKGSCLPLPIVAGMSLQVHSDTIEADDRAFVYVWWYKEN